MQRVDISPASVSVTLTKLIEMGMIRETRDGKFKRYFLIDNPQTIVQLMKNYQIGIWTAWSNRLAEMFLSLSLEEKN
jgi:DNA-binding transcriptional ArsR family regulator